MEIRIVKTTICTVKDKEFNEYGDIIFHDREGNQYKIGNKRAHLDEKLVVGRAVELGWGRFKDATKTLDYIADVKLIELPAEEQLVEGELPKKPVAKPAAKPPEPKPEAPKTDHMPSGQEIGRAWNGIDALYIGGKLATLFGKENAEAILKYYRGILTSTLRLPIDGAKLPMWDKKKE